MTAVIHTHRQTSRFHSITTKVPAGGPAERFAPGYVSVIRPWCRQNKRGGAKATSFPTSAVKWTESSPPGVTGGVNIKPVWFPIHRSAVEQGPTKNLRKDSRNCQLFFNLLSQYGNNLNYEIMNNHDPLNELRFFLKVFASVHSR